MKKDEYHTFHRWRELGYTVNKGEKSYKTNQFGQAIFGIEQVVPLSKKRKKYDTRYLYEEPDDKWLFT